jgi:alpha-1,2-mannosyltransferase
MQLDLRDAKWLDRERLRNYPLMLLVGYAACIAYLFWTAQGHMDQFGRPLGSDFANIWTAGLRVLEGMPELAFDPERHRELQNQIFPSLNGGFFGWHYPPMFLAIAGLLAKLPYVPSLIIWQAVTLLLYLGVVMKILPHRLTWLVAIAFPAVIINLLHGHNGFLTAALLGGGLILLPKRPVFAGILFGFLAYKPQFAIAIPIALLAAQQWRAIAAATFCVVAVSGLSWLAFGAESWLAFFKFSDFTRTVVLEQGNTGWAKIQSAFAAMRMLGGSVTSAYVFQGIVSLLTIAGTFVLWRSRADYAFKAAALCAAVLLSTPYLLDYDMMVLGPAIAFLAMYGIEKGFTPYEKLFLVFVWFMPALARMVAMLTLVPLGLLSLVALFILCLYLGLTKTERASLALQPTPLVPR